MARRRSRNPRPTNPRKRGRPSPSAGVAAAADSDSDSDSDFALSSDHSDIDLEEFLQVPVIPQIPRQVPKPPRRRSRNPPPRRRDPEAVLKWEVLEDQNDKWIADHRFDSPEDDVTAAGNITAEPSAVITLPLLRFQKEFLFWALNQERSDVRGGILADEMGMGKTIQAISMVLTARDNWQKSRILESSSSSSSSLPVVGATLVICPVVAVIQWAGEIERYTEKGSVRVLIYHGANRAKCEYDFDKYDFVVTTYQTIEYDYRKNVMPLGEKCMYCGRRFKKRSLKIHLRYHCGPGAKKTEKQAKTKKKGGEGKGKAKKGKEKEKEKEVDDGVEDVGDGVRGVSLLHSVKWERIILDEAHFIKDRNSNTARAIFALQSRYKWALSGTPLQNRVGELYSLVRFLQAYPYANYFCKDCDCSIFDHTASDSGTCFSCPHSITRHFCWWNRYVNKPIQSGISYDSEGAMIFLRRKILKSIVLRRTKKGRAADLALPPRIVTLRKDYLDKGENEIYEALYTQSRVEFDTYVVAGTLMNNYAHIFDLLTRLRQAVDHPYLVICSKTAGLQNEDQADNVKDNCGICHEAAEDEVVTSCEHVFCKACLLDYSAVLGNVSCPSCAKPLTVDLTTNMSGEKNYSATPIKGYKRSGILNRVKLSEFKTSTKIDALREEIRNMVESDGSAKGIVFSQFTSFLDLINYSLEMSGIKCVQLVGSMSLAEREKAINTFTENSDCRIFLMSLRAGGVALNLTVASHVFLMDPWWNPAVESQAQDRIHRIGQFKPIRIVRFVIENTIEERILKLQEKKQLVFEGTVGNSADAMSKLTEADLRFLFQ